MVVETMIKAAQRNRTSILHHNHRIYSFYSD